MSDRTPITPNDIIQFPIIANWAGAQNPVISPFDANIIYSHQGRLWLIATPTHILQYSRSLVQPGNEIWEVLPPLLQDVSPSTQGKETWESPMERVSRSVVEPQNENWEVQPNDVSPSTQGKVKFESLEAVYCLTEGEFPQWCPTSEQVAFLKGEPRQVWIWDANSREERQITEFSQGVLEFVWSPDGFSIAAITSLPKPTETQSTIIEIHKQPLPPGQALFIVNLTTKETRKIVESQPGVKWTQPAWSPNKEHIALRENVFWATLGERQMQLAVVELSTGEISYPIGCNRCQTGCPQWSPDGTKLAFRYSPYDYVFPYRSAIGIVEASGGEMQLLAEDYCILFFRWHPDNRRIFALNEQGINISIQQIDTLSDNVEILANHPGIYEEFNFNKDGSQLVCTYATPIALPEVYLLSTDSKERRLLSDTSQSLEKFHLANTEIFKWRSPDKLELEGLLTFPLNYQPGLSYPTIVDLHPGPDPFTVSEFHPEWHFLAAHGYLIFAPGLRSGQTYGWCPPPTGIEHDFADMMAGVDNLVARGLADSKRLGVRGFSHGATVTAWTIGHTSRFQAAVVEGGGYSTHLTYGLTKGMAPLGRALGGKPWEVPELYDYHSPLTYMHRAQTPTLILHGEQDRFAQAEMLYTWLFRSGVEVEFVKYLGEGHGLYQPEHRRDYWGRILTWFYHYLQYQ